MAGRAFSMISELHPVRVPSIKRPRTTQRCIAGGDHNLCCEQSV